ncbi:putative ABC transport system substrate-binding protein [Aequitasia blattaphilus]|uniref:ABC transporter substrate-binding protein n=1 Tax=Aequitasia blattaphilus TaxID=2949332 RepID=A0ABT1E5S1_9FIRM|nr:ABC transporter substrate-binding protein [Aequitasia blattaphilus]MCP1101194.1 ABC transporter substrate-binding protein [Aequitasia blattaphilus]MCR8613834.1 ABC transporter substrate-binding protein [Aequitasia blattaphilus]
MKKRFVAGLLGVALVAGLAVGCQKQETKEEGKESYEIGISQFAEHGSLDNCREGFLAGLKKEGIVEGENLTVQYKNGQADMGVVSQISDGFVSGKVDMVCAIATPSAQSAYNAAMDTDIPVVYTAVTDPVAAELSDADGNGVGEVTGTSDQLPVKEQLEMIREILPKAKTIGIMYTTSEANSVAAIEEYKELAPEFDFEIKEVGVNNTSEVALATETLLTGIDCVSNLTDNTVVASLPGILDKANAKNIPVFGSEIEQVKIGCLAAQGIDYIALGEQTGVMAAKILKGEEKASGIPFETISEPGFYVNLEVSKNLDIKISNELMDTAVESFESIEVK